MWKDQSPQQFVTVPLNDCVMFICEGIMKLRGMGGSILITQMNGFVICMGQNQLFLDISNWVNRYYKSCRNDSFFTSSTFYLFTTLVEDIPQFSNNHG